MRHITQKGLDLIKHFEGFRGSIYLDPAGYRTIGYGHLVLPGEKFRQPMSETKAESLLKKDVGIAESAVTRLIRVNLSDGQFDALVSFTYNLGSGALQSSTLRQKLNRGEYLDAAREFGRWIYAGGVSLKGLARRRAAETLTFLSY